MAATCPWKPLFWVRVDTIHSSPRVACDLLAAALREITTTMGTADADRALALIELAEERLVEASSALGFALSFMGTVELLVLRHLQTDDGAEQRALANIRAARVRAGAEYDAVGRCRGHLRVAGRLLDHPDIPGVDNYIDAERLAAIGDLEPALQEAVAIAAATFAARGAAAGN